MADFADFTEILTWGKTHRFRFTVQIGGVAQNIASWQSFKLTARRTPTDTVAVFSLTSPSGGITLPNAGADGIGEVEVPPTATSANLPNVGQTLFAEIEGIDAAGKPWPLSRGTFPIVPAIVHTP